MTDRPVLFASYSGLFGGAERVLIDSATRLNRRVAVAAPEGPLAERLRAAGIPHVRIADRTLRRGPRHAAGLFGMARELAELDCTALVAWGARATMAAALLPRRRRPPVLAVHHDLHRSPALRGAVRAMTRRADAIAAASHAIARELRLDAVVLHPGVDLDAFTPAPLPEGPPHALVLGALVAWKRPDLALEIAARMPELHITLAGEPIGEFHFETDLPSVTVAGRTDDVPAALASAHVLLHCADAEPYGLALVEALAAGRPVVAPANAGPLEIVTDGAGRLYPPGDADAAVQALRAALADPDAPAAARRRAESAFDVRDSVRRLDAAINAAIVARADRRPPADVTASG